VNYAYELTQPYGASLSKLGCAQQHHIALWICPHSGPEATDSQQSCTVWFRMANTPNGQPDSAVVDFQNTIFAQDERIVASQRPRRLPLDASERHGPLDRVSAAYRRFLDRSGVKSGVVPKENAA
jgi:phenylpropionate dioxygenase-like ring-hydroxylating dioxygenase large terminal subunit